MSSPDQDPRLDWRAEVDRWWAEVLRLPVAAVRSGGVFAANHVDHLGVVAVNGSDAKLIYAPGQVLPAVSAALRAGPVDPSDGQHLAAALGSQAGRVLGPAWYGYVTAQTLAPLPGGEARPLTETDLPLLARLRARTPPTEREE